MLVKSEFLPLGENVLIHTKVLFNTYNQYESQVSLVSLIYTDHNRKVFSDGEIWQGPAYQQ